MGNRNSNVLELGNRRIEVLETISQTDTAIVYRVIDTTTQQTFALKSMICDAVSYELTVRWQKHVWQRLQEHPNITKCYGLKSVKGNDKSTKALLLLFEFCSGGPLGEVLNRSSGMAIRESLMVMANIADALLHLHTQDPPVAHWDLNLHNIILHETGKFKIADLSAGSAGPFEFKNHADLVAVQSRFERTTQLEFRAPEMINVAEYQYVGLAADIWALGVLWFILLYGYPPFSSIEAILTQDYAIPEEPAYPALMTKMLKKLLALDPDKRPSIDVVKRMIQYIVVNLIPNNQGKGSVKLKKYDSNARTSFGGSASTVVGMELYGSEEINAFERFFSDEALIRPPSPMLLPTPSEIEEEDLKQDNNEPDINALLEAALAKILNLSLKKTRQKNISEVLQLEATNEMTCSLICNEILSNGQITNNAVIAFKAFQLLHHMMLRGSSLVLKVLFSLRPQVKNILAVWYQRRDAIAAQQPVKLSTVMKDHMVTLIATYIRVLADKIKFHKQFPIFEGNFSMDMYLAHLMQTGFHGIENLRDYLHVLCTSLDSIFVVGNAFLHVAELSIWQPDHDKFSIGIKENSALEFMSSVLQPVICDIHRIFVTSSFLMQFVVGFEAYLSIAVYKPFKRMVPLYSTYLNRYRSFLETHGEKIIAAGAENLPVLPNSNPELSLKLGFKCSVSNISNLASRNDELCCALRDHLVVLGKASIPVQSSVRQGASSSFRQRTRLKKKARSMDSSQSIDAENIWKDLLGSPEESKNLSSPADQATPIWNDLLGIPEGSPADVEEISRAQSEGKIEDIEVFSLDHSQHLSAEESVLSDLFTELERSGSGMVADFKMDQMYDDEIDLEELEFGDRVGLGGFAEVFKAEWRGTDVAVKKLLMSKQTEETLDEFNAELNMMRRLRHPNIVMFMGAVTEPPNLCLVTELMQMSLFDLLHNTRVKLNWKIRIKIAVDTAKGMNYLHKCNPPIIHRDLKSANLLLDRHYGVRVSDFGLSRVKAMSYTMTGQTGTFQWMAPEVIASERYTEKADVYSFGVILWELIAREIPFAGKNGVQVSVAVVTKGLRPEIPAETPPVIADLIQRCWHIDPEMRPPFDEILPLVKSLSNKT